MSENLDRLGLDEATQIEENEKENSVQDWTGSVLTEWRWGLALKMREETGNQAPVRAQHYRTIVGYRLAPLLIAEGLYEGSGPEVGYGER